MAEVDKDNVVKPAFLSLVRELTRAYQAFTQYDAGGFHGIDLTSAQAAVIFALGNSDGLSFREIGEATQISKGTLTGVIDRLEAKHLVQRSAHQSDHRSTLVRLTAGGDVVYATQYPRHIAYLKQRFDGLSKKERKEATAVLKKLRQLFE